MQGKIAGIAIKEARGATMKEVESAPVDGDGLSGNAEQAEHRRVTLLSSEQWSETMTELDADLPWHTRRANVLIEGLRGPEMMGKRVQLGNVELQINGETKPCGQMEQILLGLEQALVPECRGGVYGNVVQPGTIRVGDVVRISE